MSAPVSAEALLDKIKALPPERMSQVADFVEFLATQEQRSNIRVNRLHVSANSTRSLPDRDGACTAKRL